MSWLLKENWFWAILAALVGFVLTLLWMMRKVQVTETQSVEVGGRRAAGAAGVGAVGAVATGAAAARATDRPHVEVPKPVEVPKTAIAEPKLEPVDLESTTVRRPIVPPAAPVAEPELEPVDLESTTVRRPSVPPVTPVAEPVTPEVTPEAEAPKAPERPAPEAPRAFADTGTAVAPKPVAPEAPEAPPTVEVPATPAAAPVVAAAAVTVGAYGAGSAVPGPGGAAPSGDYTVKGNEDSMKYHTTESPYYGRTIAEVWFDSEDSAKSAGFHRWDDKSGNGGAHRLAEVPRPAASSFGAGSADPLPGGDSPHADFTVKGNADSMKYHSTESPYYGRTIAEVWFDSEESAAAAGFKHWRD